MDDYAYYMEIYSLHALKTSQVFCVPAIALRNRSRENFIAGRRGYLLVLVDDFLHTSTPRLLNSAIRDE